MTGHGRTLGGGVSKHDWKAAVPVGRMKSLEFVEPVKKILAAPESIAIAPLESVLRPPRYVEKSSCDPAAALGFSLATKASVGNGTVAGEVHGFGLARTVGGEVSRHG